MLLVDDVLMFPVRGALWIFEEIHNAAKEALVHEAESATADLSDLYMSLETGRITEEEFSAEEKILLDRLAQVEQMGRGQDEEDEDKDPN